MAGLDQLYSYTVIPGDWSGLEIVINDLISRTIPNLVAGSTVYYGPPNGAGVYPDGTWRTMQVGDNLEHQVKISGTWTTAFRIERPA